MQGALIAQGLKARAEVCAEPHLGGLHINGHFLQECVVGMKGRGYCGISWNRGTAHGKEGDDTRILMKVLLSTVDHAHS